MLFRNITDGGMWAFPGRGLQWPGLDRVLSPSGQQERAVWPWLAFGSISYTQKDGVIGPSPWVLWEPAAQGLTPGAGI